MTRMAGIACGFGMVVVGQAGVLAGQQAPTYGVDSVSTYVVTAWDMATSDSNVEWATTGPLGNTHRYLTSLGQFVGAVHIPQGALIVSIELEACDSSDVGAVVAFLSRETATGPTFGLANVQTGDSPTPGCGTTVSDLSTPETVENNANRYIVTASNTIPEDTTTLGAVRVHYQLQVSPAPGSATFNDVPISDPAFQFIEALVASGITVGCGGSNYCPDAPLTRRQMAVFLSKALGLHWPDGPGF
jgi:hypothetical protein